MKRKQSVPKTPSPSLRGQVAIYPLYSPFICSRAAPQRRDSRGLSGILEHGLKFPIKELTDKMSGRGEKRLFRKLGSRTSFRLQGGDEQTCRTTTITQAHLFRFNDGRYNSAQMIDCKGLWMHYCVIHYQHLHKTSLVSRMFSQASIFSRDTKLNWSWSRSHYCVMALKSHRWRTQQREHGGHGPDWWPRSRGPSTERVSATARWCSPTIFSPYWSFVRASVAWVFWMRWRDSLRGRRRGSCNSFWFMPPCLNKSINHGTCHRSHSGSGPAGPQRQKHNWFPYCINLSPNLLICW